MKRALLAAIAWLALCAPSYAVVSVVNIPLTAPINHTSATSLTFTTQTNDCPVGSSVYVAVMFDLTSGTITSIGDGTSNSYVGDTSFASGAYIMRGFMSKNTGADIPIGSTYTLVVSGATTAAKIIVIACVEGGTFSGGYDIQGSGNTGATNSPLYPSAGNTPALQNSTEVAFAMVGWRAATGTLTQDSNYTTVGSVQQDGTSLVTLGLGAWINPTSTGIKYAPSISASENWLANIDTIYNTSSTATPAALLTGVGP